MFRKVIGAIVLSVMMVMPVVGSAGAVAPAKPSLTGNWKVSANVDIIGSVTATAALKQTGTRVTATVSALGYKVKMNGTIIGKTLTLKGKAAGYTGTLKGTVNSTYTSISGKLSSSAGLGGTFTATKQ